MKTEILQNAIMEWELLANAELRARFSDDIEKYMFYVEVGARGISRYRVSRAFLGTVGGRHRIFKVGEWIKLTGPEAQGHILDGTIEIRINLRQQE
jgi:hypothetical protein